jgi:glycosyltransferase involved in cell wall biosynthesis
VKIGMINDSIMLASLEHLYSSIERALGKQHEIVYRPPEFWHSYGSRREGMNDDMIRNCDILIGWIDDALLEARQRVGKHVPYIWFGLGNMTRGFYKLKANAQYFKTTDMLVCNCTGDVEVARKFLSNAPMRILPISYDESNFYPSDEDSRGDIKIELGFRPEDKILLYAGRITVEKNVQTVLKIFSVLQGLVPDVHLALVGQDVENPFMEFGVFPTNIRNTLFKMVKKLGVAPERVHFFGRKSMEELRNLYSVTDVMVNMTLHHDENFGLGQVEAMACGTPVVCTNWGGLKDTVVDGETGFRVSTYATSALGVKADWWGGVSKIASLLTSDEAERRRLRRNSVEHARENFSFATFSRILKAIVAESAELQESAGEPLELTDFAQEFWRNCPPIRGPLPYYRYSPRSYQLYQQLITPYAGAMSDSVAFDKQLSPDDVLCLATPVLLNDDGAMWADDIIFPLSVTPLEAHAAAARVVLEAMKAEPVMKVESLLGNHLSGHENASDALVWMLDAGLILRTQSGLAPPENLGALMGTPLFTVQRVTPSVDIVLLG